MEIGKKIEDLIYSKKDEALVSFIKENNQNNGEIWWESDLSIYTPLSFACELNRLKTVQTLIAHSLVYPDFKSPEIEMRTYLDPVSTAANNGNKDIVSILLGLGFSGLTAKKMFERVAGNGSVEDLFKLLPAKDKAIYDLVTVSVEKGNY